MKRRQSGVTLVEAMISVSMVGALVMMVYGFVAVAEKSYGIEMRVRQEEMSMHVFLDQTTRDIRECSNGLVWTANFTDTSFPSGYQSQSLIMFLSPRDNNSKFLATAAQPQYNKIIIYAPYWNPEKQTGEIRKYISTPVPPSYLNPGFNPNINVNPINIVTVGGAINRNGGTVAMSGITQLIVTSANGLYTIQIKKAAIVDGTPLNMDMSATVVGKN